jgi:L-iditol 2-dehydrogenase
MRGLAKTRREAGAMELVDVPDPTVGPGEALVEVDYAGLCGSDAGIYKFKPAFERMDLPTVIGHEYTGRVVEAGADVTGVAAGDRVVERPIRGCGDCYQCRAGDPNVCQAATITGVDRDGAYRGAIAVPADVLNVIPDDVDPRHAALVEPTSIGTRAVIENSRIRAGSTVLVEGPGPIGLLTAQVARAQGGDVVVSGVGPDGDYRLPLAEELGFETVNLDEDDLAAEREARTDGVGYDVVFDTTGHPSGLTTAADQVRKGGQVVLVGMTGETTMDYAPLVRGEVDLQCSYASVWTDFERAIDLIRSGDVDLETTLDDRFSLTDADEAFEAFLAGETCKPLFDVSVLRE